MITMSQSSSKKTIQINTDFFKLPSVAKTKKRRDTPRNMGAHLIQPNSLKKELLNRIKQHKNASVLSTPASNDTFTDEFMDSIQYLDALSKTSVPLSTTPSSVHNVSFSPYPAGPTVSLELPESLKEIRSPFTKTDVPYGCLKGGKKPTYRTWKNGTTNKPFTNQPIINQPIINKPFTNQPSINQPIISKPIISKPSVPLDRERKLESLKEKATQQKIDTFLSEQPFIKPITQKSEPSLPVEEPKNELKDLIEKESNKKTYVKTTRKTKYTLGKSKTQRKVGVLIKNRATRKNIVGAHKDLKKEALQDVKKYLRQHGLLKAGSNAPNDVIRKLYEATMLTGDITNSNTDILMHNFINDV